MRHDSKITAAAVSTFDDSEAIKLTVASLSKLLKIVRKDFYGNPLRTCIQEYMSNAIDAHNDAKVIKPIQITLPSVTSPCIKIRDFGKGLSRQEMKEILCSYTASTKDGDDEALGGYGLGAKSGWAYSETFFSPPITVERKRFI